MKTFIRNLRNQFSLFYAMLNHLVMTIMVLGILEIGIYYEMIVSMMAVLAPELAPIIVILFIWIAYKGIKKLYDNSKNKKYCFI
jgi:hypothetical protein